MRHASSKLAGFAAGLLLLVGLAGLVVPPDVLRRHRSAGASSSPGGMTLSEVPTSASTRKIHAPPQPGELRTMQIKELGNFDYDPQASPKIPEDVRQLNGMKVRLSGFMVPIDESEEVRRFGLVPSLYTCCYGKPPGVQHTVMVECDPRQHVMLTTDPVVVEGTLKVAEFRQEGYLLSIFHVDCTSVVPEP